MVIGGGRPRLGGASMIWCWRRGVILVHSRRRRRNALIRRDLSAARGAQVQRVVGGGRQMVPVVAQQLGRLVGRRRRRGRWRRRLAPRRLHLVHEPGGGHGRPVVGVQVRGQQLRVARVGGRRAAWVSRTARHVQTLLRVLEYQIGTAHHTVVATGNLRCHHLTQKLVIKSMLC